MGRVLDPEINGRTLPFQGVPVQGFSSIIALDDSHYQGSFILSANTSVSETDNAANAMSKQHE